MASTIQPETVSRELADLWVSLGGEHGGESSAGVLRACSMTLIVLAEETDDAQAIGETLAALMPDHPSRAIVIRLRPSAERDLSARVFAQCWMPFRQRRQICCEQIEVTASHSSLCDIPALIMPLTVPDLPVILWCRSPRLFQMRDFPQLADVAGKVIVDGSAFPDPRLFMDVAVGYGHQLADLCWTRLTRWRELICRIFENRAYMLFLPRVSHIRIVFTGEKLPIAAYYLGAWLMEGVRTSGGHAPVEFESGAGSPGDELNGVEMIAGDVHFSIALDGREAAEIRFGTRIERSAFPRSTDYLLMREELGIAGRDQVFEMTLGAALTLARENR